MPPGIGYPNKKTAFQAAIKRRMAKSGKFKGATTQMASGRSVRSSGVAGEPTKANRRSNMPPPVRMAGRSTKVPGGSSKMSPFQAAIQRRLKARNSLKRTGRQ